MESSSKTFTKTSFAAAVFAGAALLAAPLSGQAAPLTYALDKGHTEIQFFWDHAGVSEQSGEFAEFDGELTFDPDDPTKSSLMVTIPSASIATGVKALDDHLKSKDFFEVETYPTITFKSTGVAQTGKGTGNVTGDLTIHGVTKPVTLDVQLVHQGEHPLGAFIDYYKGQWLGFYATGTILRSDFDVGRFAPLTSDRITLRISTELKAKE